MCASGVERDGQAGSGCAGFPGWSHRWDPPGQVEEVLGRCLTSGIWGIWELKAAGGEVCEIFWLFVGWVSVRGAAQGFGPSSERG